MVRLSQTEQNILGDLHKWTNGEFWKRLIFLDRTSFTRADLFDRSTSNKSFWHDSQNTTDLKNTILKTSQRAFNNWKINENGHDRDLMLSDLEGLKRLPFDASQTMFCDKWKENCHSEGKECSNNRRRICSKMPVWKNEFSDGQFDSDYNDDDYYLEYDYNPFVFWEDIDPSKESKYFFIEQLKLLSSYIHEAKPKVIPATLKYLRDIESMNDSYRSKFFDNETLIETCEASRNEDLKNIQENVVCNQWTSWTETTKCPLCGRGNSILQRKCMNAEKGSKLKSLLEMLYHHILK